MGGSKTGFTGGREVLQIRHMEIGMLVERSVHRMIMFWPFGKSFL